MEPTFVMIIGFLLAAYAIVANDSIQTLGTFLSSNSKRPWWLLWLFAGSILAAVVIYGWVQNAGDPAYGRLDKIALPENLSWFYLLPPIALLMLTRWGLPVSTTFIVLTAFSQKALGGMLIKSLSGYLVAFVAGLIIYLAISRFFEKKAIASAKQVDEEGHRRRWIAAQWLATGFLWSQWLIQDLANIYVYLPRKLTGIELGVTLVAMLAMQGFIIRSKGGAIQKIVTAKTNLSDIRSATIVDLIFAFILFYFKGMNKVPMSTTWVFIGLLAGREIALAIRLRMQTTKSVLPQIGGDLWKASVGLAVSVAVALSLPFLVGSEEKSDKTAVVVVKEDNDKAKTVEPSSEK